MITLKKIAIFVSLSFLMVQVASTSQVSAGGSDKQYKQENPKIAVIDASFSSNVVAVSTDRECFESDCGTSYIPQSYIKKDEFTEPKCLHGTAVVETYVNTLKKLTDKNPEIYIYKLTLSNSGNGVTAESMSRALASFRINNSKNKIYSLVASFGIDVPNGKSCKDIRIPQMFAELQAIASSGVSLFFPAGNGKGPVNWPACENFVDAVGATQVGVFSEGEEIDYRANAESIPIRDNLGSDIKAVGGTSFAAPQIAAQASFINMERFSLFPHDVKKLIQSSSSLNQLKDNIDDFSKTPIPSSYYVNSSKMILEKRFAAPTESTKTVNQSTPKTLLKESTTPVWVIATLVIILLGFIFFGLLLLVRYLVNPRY